MRSDADRDRRGERDVVGDGAGGDRAEAERAFAAAGRRGRGEGRPEGADARGDDDPEPDAEEAAGDALRERLADDLPDDEAAASSRAP